MDYSEQNAPLEPVYDPSKHRLAIRLQHGDWELEDWPVFSSWEAATHQQVVEEFRKLGKAFGIDHPNETEHWHQIVVGYVPQAHISALGGDFTLLNREVR